jgi:hypothetical protein
MAGFNEILVGRYNRALQKLLSMKGPAAMNTLSGELAATISTFYGVENRYLESWNRFGVSTTQPAGGAGLRAAIRFRNPPGSGLVAVLEKLIASVGVADQPFLNISTTAATGDFAGTVITANTALDNRGSQSPALRVTATGDSAPLLGVTIEQVTLPAVSNYDFIVFEDHELPILPGSAYTLYSNVLNQSLNFTALWRERTLEESELK